MPFTLRRDALLSAALLIALLGWDASGLDLALARLYGDAGGFAWREHPLPRAVLHDGGRLASAVVLALLAWNVWRPLRCCASLARSQRAWWLCTVVLSMLLVTALKRLSLTSCPWSLADFGGSARWVSHWAWGVADGGGGRCFPSGHASAAFAHLAAWFALRERHARAAHAALVLTVVLGSIFGWGQMVRGAHFASHTLWTAWICWTAAALSWHAWQWARRTKAHR